MSSQNCLEKSSVPTFPASLSKILPNALTESLLFRVFQENPAIQSLALFFSSFPWKDTDSSFPTSISACQIPALLQNFCIGFSPKRLNYHQTLVSSTLRRVPEVPWCTGFVPAFQFFPSPLIRYVPHLRSVSVRLEFPGHLMHVQHNTGGLWNW